MSITAYYMEGDDSENFDDLSFHGLFFKVHGLNTFQTVIKCKRDKRKIILNFLMRETPKD